MNVTTEIAAGAETIEMRRIFDAPRPLVWAMMTQAEHVARWWGGPGFTNPVCEMDVRVGGLWRHVMRFPNGDELEMNFVFVEVDAPRRLAWRHAEPDARGGPPTSVTTLTLDELGERTAWKMIARFQSTAARDAAVALGFANPIAASAERLAAYLKRV